MYCCHFISQVFSSGPEESLARTRSQMRGVPSPIGYSHSAYLSRRSETAFRLSSGRRTTKSMQRAWPSLQRAVPTRPVPPEGPPHAPRSDRKTSRWCGTFQGNSPSPFPYCHRSQEMKTRTNIALQHIIPKHAVNDQYVTMMIARLNSSNAILVSSAAQNFIHFTLQAVFGKHINDQKETLNYRKKTSARLR